MNQYNETILSNNETIDDLEINGFRLIQKKDGFRFGIDAVLLAHFANVKPNSLCVDLCSGSGIIPILMCAHGIKAHFCSIEILEEYANLISRNIKLNDIENDFDVINDNLVNYSKYFKPCSVDTVTVNPPYMKTTSGYNNENEDMFIARHEAKCTIDDISKCASYLLKDKGHMYMIHRPERLIEISQSLETNNLKIKNLRFVHSFADSKASMVLIDVVKSGKGGLEVSNPLIIYKDKSVYSDEVLRIYNKI